jgi:hypothetical protein
MCIYFYAIKHAVKLSGREVLTRAFEPDGSFHQLYKAARDMQAKACNPVSRSNGRDDQHRELRASKRT